MQDSRSTQQPPLPAPLRDEAEQENFQPWTAAQAQAWRRTHPAMPRWWPVQVQAVVAVVVTLLAWLLAGAFGWSQAVVWSAGYGACASVVPAAVFTWGYQRMTRAQAVMPTNVAAGVGFMALFLWEGVKILLTIAWLWTAPRWVGSLNWLAMLIAFVVVVKGHWLALMMRRRQ